MNSKKVGKVIGVALVVFLLAMMMQPVMAGVSAEITGVELNGQDGFIEVEPGELIGVEVFFKWTNVWSLQENLDEIVVGFEGTPIFCVVNAVIDNIDVYDSKSIRNCVEAFEITAPAEPGTYCVYMITTTWCTCEEAKLIYQNAPGLQQIADFEVIGDEEEEEKWKLICKEGIKVDYILRDGFDVYWTEIYQRKNDIRIEHYTDDEHPIFSGSVSISVNEDVKIDYTTGKVYYNTSGGDSECIEIRPSQIDGLDEKSTELILGSVPYLGWVLSMTDYIDYVFGNQFKRTKYKETENDKGPHMTPREHFEDRNMLNYRDIVVIPWYLSPKDPAKNISINCPEMSFGEVTQQRMVFRIDSQIYQTKVRHDIGLEIDFSESKEAREIC